MHFLDYIKQPSLIPADCGIYPRSIHAIRDGILFMANEGDTDCLVSTVDLGLEGENHGTYFKAPLIHANANVLRALFPFTAPRRVLQEEKTMGVGDRLGIASSGHIKVFEESLAIPVLAQQSMRELTLTDRTYEDVLDCVTFAVFKENFTRGFGADGDHLKNAIDVENALKLGFSMITLDCSDYIRNDLSSLSDQEITALYQNDSEAEKRYLETSFDLGENTVLTFTPEDYRRTVLIYSKAIHFATEIYHSLFSSGKYNADFEVSIDETLTPTTPLQHFYVANELIRLGVKFATIAPRFCGEFQKGIDYIGDKQQFEKEIAVHSCIARHFGYQLSIHSGSDKFSVFPLIAQYTKGKYHVKTAGTNWLEAMGVVAKTDPKLYREIHAFALAHFEVAKKYYHVTTDLSKIPSLNSLSDEELPALFTQDDARQLIHITYGLILSAKNSDGTPLFRQRLYTLWRKESTAYEQALYRHIGKHLRLLGAM
ncbi:MAG TPA: hypothetical protein DCY75_04635 [Clostridiales bacterium]|nr:hypothetical protein [Clostridiales bacterium]